MFFISNLTKGVEGVVVGVVQKQKEKKNKDKTIFCATNYPKEFMKILHGWTESVIRFIKVKQNVARNYQTSLGG